MNKMRVLFLDDEKELVDNLPAVLEVKGVEVTATRDVKKAIQLLTDFDFDVVLTDIAMPPAEDMDARDLAYGRTTGIEFVKQLRAIKPDIPVVALTVIRDEEILKQMRAVGIGWIMHKPEEPQRVLETLEKTIRR